MLLIVGSSAAGWSQDSSAVAFARPAVIPRPALIEGRSGVFELNDSTAILVHADLANTSFIREQFVKKVKDATGHELVIWESGMTRSPENAIAFFLDEERADLEQEGYALTVGEGGVLVTAARPAGLFYGMQTLLQLLPIEIESRVVSHWNEWRIPFVRIVDKPRFQWRGMHLDVCRHFFPVSFVKKYIDLMARYKLNRFHWHLTEDQGWRIEIKKYPRLTEIGGWRKETLVGHARRRPREFDGIRHGGYYSQEEVKDVVQYARERFITVVPEIEMPGHSMAALAAYPGLSCTGGPFEVATQWGVFDDVYCAGKEEVFEFLENVLGEVVDLFPGPYIHIGGDECPKKRWKACEDCQRRIRIEGLKDEHELQSYFIRRIETFLLSKDRRLIGWDEILEGGLAPEATVMSWRGMRGGIEAANAGHDVIMTPTDHCYFDYFQGKRGEPLAIGGFLPLQKVYALEPVPPDIDASKKYHILGAQANLWTEYIATPRDAEYMLFPRMCALSEVVWTEAALRDFDDFSDRMQDHYRRLALLGVNFRCPDTSR